MEDNFHQVTNYTVTSEYEGVRLDNCLIAKLKGLPRTKIYSIIRKGEVRVNKSRSKPSMKLKKGDLITFEPGSTHNSYTKNGCLLIVFMRGINKPI